MKASSRPVAAIDLGTNTALLLVARMSDEHQLEVLEQRCLTVRLGQRNPSAAAGDAPTLSPAAQQRTLAALTEFKQAALARGVAPEALRVTATAVLRRATDAGEFVGRCARDLGLQVEILSGPEEARLGRYALGLLGPEDWISVDVGGGSTEVSSGQVGEQASIPVGALTLTERFLGTDVAPAQQVGGAAALWEHTEREFLHIQEGLAGERPVVLLGGSAANLACLEKKQSSFEPDQVEGTRIQTDAVRSWATHLLDLSLEQRLNLPIERNRAEILPAGLVCLAVALERIGSGQAMVSALGLRHGVALELLRP